MPFGELEYRVTAVTFGLGMQLGATRTARLDEHVRELGADGWRLVAVNHSPFEIPLAWRFFWERRVRLPSTAGLDVEPNLERAAPRDDRFYEKHP